MSEHTSELAERIRRATAARDVTLEQRLQPLWSGYGELWRVRLDGSSAIVKDVRPPRDDGSRSHRRKLRSYGVEQAFYARHAANCVAGCPVPRALALRAEHGGVLSVLEDLNVAGFAERRHRAGPAEIQATLTWLAHFHAAFLGQAPEGLWKVGCYWHLATRPEELARMKHPALQRAAGAIDARLNAARFKTFVHGDAKLENVCFATDGRVALVDFQYVGGGVGVKDVAYFLSGCLMPEECAAQIPDYLQHYFAALRAALAQALSEAELALLESEWRDLFPLAWVDFYRFLLGWAPGQYDPDPYSDANVSQVLAELSRR